MLTSIGTGRILIKEDPRWNARCRTESASTGDLSGRSGKVDIAARVDLQAAALGAAQRESDNRDAIHVIRRACDSIGGRARRTHVHRAAMDVERASVAIFAIEVVDPGA